MNVKPDKGSLRRRDFLQLAGIGAGGLLLSPAGQWGSGEFPDSTRLGRVCVSKVDLLDSADADGNVVGALYEDAVVEWQREHVGRHPWRINQRWVETPEGFIYAPNLQPVSNLPQAPLSSLPETLDGRGMWAEVTVPWVDIVLDNPPPRSPWLKTASQPRLYYSQILWVDDLRRDSDGGVWYRVNEKYGFGDIFWAGAEAFRPLSSEELEPIRPEVEDKRVIVDVTHQTMACYEGNTEVYFCRVSTGSKRDAEGNEVDEWSTPLGGHPIWRKVVSLHMVGGTTGGGYDLPGSGWTTLFVGNGVAIHSTFWHNDFGAPRSHGCVNARPEDAKFVFRWVEPRVPYDPGDITVGMPGGTRVEVVET
jgi:lipoprotein-anchoring transpeptidase ErfK/SrfK